MKKGKDFTLGQYVILKKEDQLEVGDNVAIIFTGDIEEKEPAHINDVLKIQLLDDKK